MVNFNVGFNWDPDLAHWLIEHNTEIDANPSDYVGKVSTVYGSTQHNPIGTARPDDRVPNPEFSKWAYICSTLRSEGIKVNYTFNSSNPDIYFMTKERDRVKAKLRPILEHVDRVTVAHPAVLSLLTEMIEWEGRNISIEMSTILNIDSLGHFHYYKDQPYVDRICLAIGRNRDISFLRKLGRLPSKYPDCELLVNEFCNIAGHSCQGICRAACYNVHATNFSKEVRAEMDNFPMNICSKSRADNPEAWLKARFLLPQWIENYEALGIKHFKISGRTHPSAYIKEMVEAYTIGNWSGNLIELWGHLEAIWTGQSSKDIAVNMIKSGLTGLNCDHQFLDRFIDHWLDNPEFRCSERLCGVSEMEVPSGCVFCNRTFTALNYKKENK